MSNRTDFGRIPIREDIERLATFCQQQVDRPIAQFGCNWCRTWCIRNISCHRTVFREISDVLPSSWPIPVSGTSDSVWPTWTLGWKPERPPELLPECTASNTERSGIVPQLPNNPKRNRNQWWPWRIHSPSPSTHFLDLFDENIHPYIDNEMGKQTNKSRRLRQFIDIPTTKTKKKNTTKVERFQNNGKDWLHLSLFVW